ncbi:hypothetical protein Syun_016564 [Stephania yunnanensis]|uniref:Uncharacterized protein n=1 Tax=Stephania yunnanensis TaxID=152371 RepID=A0AAP0J529_9MAGN
MRSDGLRRFFFFFFFFFCSLIPCMAGDYHRVRETDLADSSRPSNQYQTPSYAVLQHGSITTSPNLINQQESSFDFGELGEAIIFDGLKSKGDEAKKSFYSGAGGPAATLEMFPSWPMKFHTIPRGSSKSGEESTDSGSALNNVACKADSHLEPESPISLKKGSRNQSLIDHNKQQLLLVEMPSATDTTGADLLQNQQHRPLEQRKGSTSTSISNKPLDAKTLRRLAQNREAARKSRLRKKAYVQQLESSRVRLSQLEQDLQRARSQGLLVSAGGASGNISPDAAIFDMEYARWIEDEHRHMSELRAGLQANLSDGELRVILDGYLTHYDNIFRIKGIAAKSDVFHLINGMWTTPAERCFLWMGGFRPSELLKVLMPQLDPLTDHQIVGICSLQQSSQQAEEALSQGLEQLHQSLNDTVASGSLGDRANVNDYMGQMALALSKIASLEGFVRQADNLRQETLHQLCRILTVRQAGRCLLAMGEYNNRLRALSSLWASRPRELDQC